MKRSIRKLALQGTQITTPRDFFNACKRMDSSIAFEYCTNDDVQLANEVLNLRYEAMKIKTIVGTTQYHAFIPLDTQTISVKTFSFSMVSKPVVIATLKSPNQ